MRMDKGSYTNGARGYRFFTHIEGSDFHWNRGGLDALTFYDAIQFKPKDGEARRMGSKETVTFINKYVIPLWNYIYPDEKPIYKCESSSDRFVKDKRQFKMMCLVLQKCLRFPELDCGVRFARK